MPELEDDMEGRSKSLARVDNPKSARHAEWFSSIRMFAYRLKIYLMLKIIDCY